MSAVGGMNTKNPTIKRIHREALELSAHPSSEFTAAPQETNLFEWHFTITGPPDSPYAGGIYHGRISLPPAYPLRPPSFRFLTPSGRFEVNREICLSISGHHEESWQPAWGIRTALVAMRSFMDTDAKGQLGGIDTNKETRLRLALASRSWRCGDCGKTNSDLMQELEEECKRQGSEDAEESIPQELRLGYRDELGTDKGKKKAAAEPGTQEDLSRKPTEQQDADASPAGAAMNRTPTVGDPPGAPRMQQAQLQTAQLSPPSPIQATGQAIQQRPSDSHHWMDMAISGVALALILMLIRKVVPYL